MPVHNSQNTDQKGQSETGIILEERLKAPASYAVVVHNDPFTPRVFVVEVLRVIFQKSEEQAQHIMLKAHTTGQGVVSVYSREVAEMKAGQANKYSHDHGKLLIFSIEEV